MSKATAVLLKDPDYVGQIRNAFDRQHAIHGVMGHVFQQLEEESIRETGSGFVLNWARDNPGRFINLICRMTPTIAPMTGMQGDVNLTVNHTLISTALDD